MKSFSRKHLVFIISLLVVIATLGYGAWQQSKTSHSSSSASSSLSSDTAIDTSGFITHKNMVMTDGIRQMIEANIAADQKTSPQTEASLIDLAQNQTALGSWSDAKQTYLVIIESFPSSTAVWGLYASLLEQMGDYVSADTTYQQAITVEPTEKNFRAFAAFLQLHFKGHVAELKTVLDAAQKALGDTIFTTTSLGDWYFSNNDCASGKSSYATAIKLSPDATTKKELTKIQKKKLAECK